MLRDQNDSGLKTPYTWKCLNLKDDRAIEDSNQNFLCVEVQILFADYYTPGDICSWLRQR
jgi:hypothetical protein